VKDRFPPMRMSYARKRKKEEPVAVGMKKFTI
jgi:hypothetical protein